MTQEEILEVTHLHSLASHQFGDLLTSRPFRAPHHSASLVAIVGGGQPVKPGEISLSHGGVLFLDEMPEFSRQTLEALRQPLEDRCITVTRARQTVTYPAAFVLVATANPCPCGYYGSDQACHCTAAQIHAYQQKLSGPILDRIDIFTTVSGIDHTKLLAPKACGSSDEAAKEQIFRAQQLQHKRYGAARLNSSLTQSELRTATLLEPAAKKILDMAAGQLKLSPRAYLRTVKVGRTIADLAQSATIKVTHISEALQYRRTTTQH